MMLKMKDFQIMRENINLVKKAMEKPIEDKEEITIRYINEEQYNSFFLNETLHYSDFLDPIYEQVWSMVARYIPTTLVGHVKKIRINIVTQYFNGVEVEIMPFLSGNWSVGRTTSYTGECDLRVPFNDGKLINPKIKLRYPVYENGFTVDGYIKAALCHELTHIYDHYILLTTKSSEQIESLVRKIEGDNMIAQSIKSTHSRLGDLLYDIMYMSSTSERHSYVTQAMKELETVGCSRDDANEKLKETFLYKNISHLRKTAEDEIKNADEDTLYRIDIATRTFGSSLLPVMQYRQFDPEEYRKRMLCLVDRLCHDYIKKLIGVVWYYLKKKEAENILSNNNRHDDMFL